MNDASQKYLTVERSLAWTYTTVSLLIALAILGFVFVTKQVLSMLGDMPWLAAWYIALMVASFATMAFLNLGGFVYLLWSRVLIRRRLQLVPFSYYSIRLKQDKFSAMDNYGGAISGELEPHNMRKNQGRIIETYRVNVVSTVAS